MMAWTTGARFFLLRVACILVGLVAGTLLLPVLR